MKLKKSQLVAAALRKGGTAQLLNLYWGQNRLTVLAYHRIFDWTAPDFDYYIPNVSATPEMFNRQMDYVEQHFNVISLDQLLAFIQHGEPLPSWPCLITFDDGYIDNYDNAYPILQKHGFPAVIFLMTDGMNNPVRPWWDVCAYYFHHTRKQRLNLPLVGEFILRKPQDRIIAREALMRELKALPDVERRAILAQLPDLLEVPLPNDPRLFVTWDQVRELVANGVACQPHTMTHPIMSRISPDEQRQQLVGSKEIIEAETGQKAVVFAYPNGTQADYTQDTMNILRELGYVAAFTLEDGPMRSRDVQANPLEIKRVFLGSKDTFDIFVLKLMGLPAFLPGY
jgi:peptidoglycan/xylan/chitin deacetylase (PgdA/CDA1 family)